MKIEKFPEYKLDQFIKEKMNENEMFIQGEYQTGTAVVLGRVTPHSSDVNEARCMQDAVPILRRKGGGGAVLLFPGVLVLSCSFKKNNSAVDLMGFLEEAVKKVKEGILDYINVPLAIRGNGDLCIGDKKILGSSIYSTKDYITYYCTLIIRGNLNQISEYLLHPSKEPEYRKGRKHEDFITSIEANVNIADEEKLFTSIIRSLGTININDLILVD